MMSGENIRVSHHIHRPGFLKRDLQSSGMIIMAVTEKNPVDAFQTFIDQLQIVRKADTGTGIEQIPVVSYFYQGTESMLSDNAGSACIIVA